jgi:copper(I)-binding protein
MLLASLALAADLEPVPQFTDTPASAYEIGALRLAAPWSNYRIGSGGSVKLFFEISNRSASDDRLVDAKASIANGPATFNLVTATHGQPGIKALTAIPIPAESGRLELSEMGYYIELSGLTMPLTMGTTFNVRLQFERAGTIDVTFTNQFHAPNIGQRILEAVRRGDLR